MKNFIQQIKREDRRIEMRKKALAQVAERAKPVTIQITEDKPEMVMNVDAPVTPANTANPSPPLSSVGAASPLHPSLPPRPTTQPTSTQSTPGPTTTTPAPIPAPAPAPAPASSPAPAQPPPAKKADPTDPQVAKFEEVRVSPSLHVQVLIRCIIG